MLWLLWLEIWQSIRKKKAPVEILNKGLPNFDKSLHGKKKLKVFVLEFSKKFRMYTTLKQYQKQ